MNIHQVANLIKTTGTEVTYVVDGVPGIGKSSILSLLKKDSKFKDYEHIYVDCPTMDIPDVQLPYVEHGVSKFATNALWGVENDRPKLIMLDELPKSSNVTRLLFTRLLLEHQIGAYKLPEGSVVFATGNRNKDGVGDTYPAHMMNRVCSIHMNKPTPEEWIDWAEDNKIDPIILAWVKQFPHCLAEDEENNPYIFNPKTNTTSFVSPRSLAKASPIVANRSAFDGNTLNAALSGTLGQSAAVDIMAYIQLADQLPTWSDVINNPLEAKLPTSAPAKLIMAYGALSQINNDISTVDSVVNYFARFEPEISAVAFSSMAKNRVVLKNATVSAWVKNNLHLIA